jgi:hypothetical protein
MPPTTQGGGCCAHDHDCEEAECGPAYALGDRVDAARVRCLNAEGPAGAPAAVLRRPWASRADPCPPPGPLRSAPDDPELLLHIPFEGGACKIKAICIIGGEMAARGAGAGAGAAGEATASAGAGAGRPPAKLRAYVNRDDLDFAAVRDLPPAQEWDLQPDGNARGVVEYPTRAALFSGVHSLDLHIPGVVGGGGGGGGGDGDGGGGDDDEEGAQCVVQFIGLKGEWASRDRRAVEAVYEARPVPGDNAKIPGLDNRSGWAT